MDSTPRAPISTILGRPARVVGWLWLSFFVFGSVACAKDERGRSSADDGASGEAGGGAAGREGTNGGDSNGGGIAAGGGTDGGASGTAGAGTTGGAGGTTANAGNGGLAASGGAPSGGTGASGGAGDASGAGGVAGAGARAGAGGVAGETPLWPRGPAECGALDEDTGVELRSSAASGASVAIAHSAERGAIVPCTISVEETLGAIPTVGVITFTVAGLAGISSAQIDFRSEAGGATLTAPVDLAAPGYRTLLLGMKGDTRYGYRISVTGSAGTCQSPEYSITTGSVPPDVKPMNVTFENAEARAKGFILATTGFGLSGPLQREQHYVYIVDTDGDPVWWAVLPGTSPSARMSFDAREIYVPVGGSLWSVGVGDSVARDLGVMSHHDVTALPDGGLATFWEAALIERAADGTITTLVPDLGALYDAPSGVHLNALHYYPWDDSFTVSDLYGSLFVKLTRQGELVWQLGGTPHADPTKFFAPAAPFTGGNHGHQLLPDGTFVFFNNLSSRCGIKSAVMAFELDATTGFAHALFTYGTQDVSEHLGDVQRLPNGNYLMTSSEAGKLVELTASGEVVARLASDELGYVEFRESLYGPPSY